MLLESKHPLHGFFLEVVMYRTVVVLIFSLLHYKGEWEDAT